MRAEEEVIPWVELENMLNDLAQATSDDDYQRGREIFKRAVSGFAPQCGIEDWLWNKKNY